MCAYGSFPVVVGIDVGGPKKGFHAVALQGGRYHDRLATREVSELVAWCVAALQATVIAIDAPCCWSTKGTGRLAERELMQQKIWCFSTPTCEVAHKPHPTGYYDWMLRGEALYQALHSTHPVSEGWPPRRKRFCFETFPHAITWHLRGGNADAKQKHAQRRQSLERRGIETVALTNIDWVDAALCAVTAHMSASGEQVKTFGETQTGFIIVPAKS